MLFIILLALTTLSIAASAAFFSVYGLMQVYSGVMIPILIMGASLEAGKLLTASYLYRHWETLGILVRTMYISAIAVLMLLTSIGIFGYLTSAYQKDSQPMKEIELVLVRDKAELEALEARKAELNKQVTELPNNFINGRNRLMITQKPELDKINPQIETLKKSISDTESKKLNTETHIGPIIFVAKAIGKDADDAVFYFTLLIISVFDPLAVALTVATNNAIRVREEKKTVKKSVDSVKIPELTPSQVLKIEPPSTNPLPEPTEAPITPTPQKPEVTPAIKPEALKTASIDENADKKRILIASTRK